MSNPTQLTREEAVAWADAEKWKLMTPLAIAHFQMNQECLCMPFDVFHAAVEEALGESVFTHQFGSELFRKYAKERLDKMVAELDTQQETVVD